MRLKSFSRVWGYADYKNMALIAESRAARISYLNMKHKFDQHDVCEFGELSEAPLICSLQ
jgi:hypothetical protein